MTTNGYERHILPPALDFACGMPMIGAGTCAGTGWQALVLQTRYLPGPRPFTFHYWGEALANTPVTAP